MNKQINNLGLSILHIFFLCLYWYNNLPTQQLKKKFPHHIIYQSNSHNNPEIEEVTICLANLPNPGFNQVTSFFYY